MVFEKDKVGIKISNAAGIQEISARYVIDCSGRNSVIGNALELKKPYPNLKKFAIFAHYDNVARDPERRARTAGSFGK